jgi:hypothetical protein
VVVVVVVVVVEAVDEVLRWSLGTGLVYRVGT